METLIPAYHHLFLEAFLIDSIWLPSLYPQCTELVFILQLVHRCIHEHTEPQGGVSVSPYAHVTISCNADHPDSGRGPD
jgi:hypothetical protein